MTAQMDIARQVADAVLYEGYLLYPYRASARKNQIRWQWGVLVPPTYAAAGHGEYDTSHTECLLDPGTDPVLHVRLRFLQLQHRSGGDGSVPEFDEAVEHEIDSVVSVKELLDSEQVVPVVVPGGTETTDDGLTRQRWPLNGEIRLSAQRLEGPYGLVQLTVEVVNTAEWADPEAARHLALRHSLLAAHTVLAVTDGEFISLTDPPEWAKHAAAACHNERVWPVMIGDADRRDVILASPIILYDYPVIASESAGDLFDGTEIDEILTLRTMTLTDEEKAEVRATDERARKLMDRVDSMPPEMLDKMHGAIRYLGETRGTHTRGTQTDGTRREPDPIETITTPGTPWWDPGADASVNPETDSVLIAGVEVAKGSQVVLMPGLRRSDAQDMFLTGRTATVAAVLLDVDGNTHVAVTLDDDPGAEISAAHGRFRYFAPDELTPLEMKT